MSKIGSTSPLVSLTSKMGLLQCNQCPYMFLCSYLVTFRCGAALTFKLTSTEEKAIMLYVSLKSICSVSKSIFFPSSLFYRLFFYPKKELSVLCVFRRLKAASFNTEPSQIFEACIYERHNFHFLGLKGLIAIFESTYFVHYSAHFLIHA